MFVKLSTRNPFFLSNMELLEYRFQPDMHKSRLHYQQEPLDLDHD